MIIKQGCVMLINKILINTCTLLVFKLNSDTRIHSEKGIHVQMVLSCVKTPVKMNTFWLLQCS